MDAKTFSPPSGLLTGKTVFISGAGAGIGRAIALETAQQGAAVFFADISGERCEKVQAELIALGTQAKGFTADLSRENAIEKLCAQLQESGVVVDTLINNVGVTQEQQGGDAQWWQSWRRVYDTNILGPCYLTKLLVDAMIEKKIPGSVLFISSIHQREVYGDPAYSSSKAALGMVVRELAIQLAAHNIRVNGIAPGYVAEDGNGLAIPHSPTPLGKTSILPRTIARAAVHLSCEYFSNRTTGSILTLDSGLSLHNHLTASSTGSTPGGEPSPFHSLARKVRRAIQPSTL